MKKKVLFSSIVVATLISGAIVFMALKPKEVPVLKEGNVPDSVALNYLETLKEAGFTHVPTVTEKVNELSRKEWAKKGFGFIGDDEIQRLLSINDLLIAPADKFTDEIPQDALKTFATNFQRAKSLGVIKDWIAPDNRTWTNEEISQMSAEDASYVHRGAKASVYICAPVHLLNTTDMVIIGNELKTANDDPIIVAKVDGGYIELARWLIKSENK